MFICQEKIADTENCVKIFFWQMGIDTSQMKQLFLYGSAAWVLPKGLKCAVYDIKTTHGIRRQGLAACQTPVDWVCQDSVNMQKCGKKCAEATMYDVAGSEAEESASSGGFRYSFPVTNVSYFKNKRLKEAEAKKLSERRRTA